MSPRLISKHHIAVDNEAIYQHCIQVIKKYNLPVKYDHVCNGVYLTQLKIDYVGIDQSQKNELLPHTWEELKSVVELVTSVCPSTEINNSFFVLSPKNGSLLEHRHIFADSKVFTYYVKIDENHPSFEYLVDGQWIPFHTKSGDLITFDNTLFHRVPENTTENDRLVITFNI